MSWREEEIGPGGCQRCPDDDENALAALEFQVLAAAQPTPVTIQARPLSHRRLVGAALGRLGW